MLFLLSVEIFSNELYTNKLIIPWPISKEDVKLLKTETKYKLPYVSNSYAIVLILAWLIFPSLLRLVPPALIPISTFFLLAFLLRDVAPEVSVS